MSQRVQRQKLNGHSILVALNPTINMVVLVTGLVVWAFNTFAQISYVKEQNQQLIGLVEQRHRDAVEHSEMNRERIMAVLMEVKESVKAVEAKIFSEVRLTK